MSIASYIETLSQITTHPLNRRRPVRAVIDYLRWNFGLRLLGIDQVLPLAGDANIILSSRQNYATLAYTCGLWDFPEMMFLLHGLRPTDRFVDIGASVGAYTLLASKVAGANSLAFEPVPATFEELMRNLRLNDILDRATGRRVCLGSDNGTVRMTAGRGALNHVATQNEAGDFVVVDVMRLDDVLDGSPCQLIKIDAEGYEAEILSGCTRTLQDPGLMGLIVELNGAGLRYGHTNDTVHEMLSARGFAPYHYDGVARSLHRRDSYNSSGLNTLYLRDTGAIEQRLRDAPVIAVRGQTF